MSLVCIASQDGSPGATTTSLLLAGLWPKSQKRKVLLEVDPSGGSLAATYQLGLDPDLVTLSEAVDSGIASKRLWEHTQLLPGSTEAVVSPPKSDDVSRVLESNGSQLGNWLNQLDEIDVFADVGSLDLASSAQDIVTAASSVLMVARPASDQLRLGAERMSELQDSVDQISWVLVGDAPYCAHEVEVAYGFPVMAVLADDPQSAFLLEQGSSVSHLSQAPLVQTARELVGVLHNELTAMTTAHSVSETAKPSEEGAGAKQVTSGSQIPASNEPMKVRTPFPTKPAPTDPSSTEDCDQTIAVPLNTNTPPSLLPADVVDVDAVIVPPSLLSGPGRVDPVYMPPSTVPSPTSGHEISPIHLEDTPAVEHQPPVPEENDLVIDDQAERVDIKPVAAALDPQSEIDVTDNTSRSTSDPGEASFQRTMEPMSGQDFWDVTTQFSTSPAPLRYSVAQDRIPADSPETSTKPPPPMIPPSKQTKGIEEKDKLTVTDLTNVDPATKSETSDLGSQGMAITEVIQAVGTPTGKNDVPPSLLSPPDVDAEETSSLETPDSEVGPSEHGRPSSLLDAKLSTSANPSDELPGFPPID